MLILLTQVLFYLQLKQAALSRYHVVKQQIKDETTSAPASFPAVLGDIRCDVTCKACRKTCQRLSPSGNSDSANWPGYKAASALNVHNEYILFCATIIIMTTSKQGI